MTVADPGTPCSLAASSAARRDREYPTIARSRTTRWVTAPQSLVQSNVFSAQHDEVYDMHQHGLAILVQGARPTLDQALLRTRL